MKRLHPFTMVAELAEWLGRMAILLIVLVVLALRRESSEEARTELIIGALAGVQVIGSIVRYRLSGYAIQDGVFTMRSGWLVKEERTIPLDRIQNVDIVRQPIHRLLGIAVVKIDAGSAGEEAKLSAVGLAEAEALIHQLQPAERRDAVHPDEHSAMHAPTELGVAVPAPVRSQGGVLWQASFKDLLMVGFTENRTFVMIAYVFALISTFLPGIGRNHGLVRDLSNTLERSSWGVGFWVAVLIGIFLLGWIASMVLAVVRFYGFELRHDGNTLRKSYGLLTATRSAIPLGRVQSLTVSAGWLRRRLGYWSVSVSTAGNALDPEVPDSGVLVPMAKSEKVGQLVGLAVPRAGWIPEAAITLPSSAIASRIIAKLVPFAIMAAIVAWVWVAPSGRPLWPVFGSIYTALMILGGLHAWRSVVASAYWWNPDHVWSQGGVVTWYRQLLPATKIQGAAWTQSPTQRRFGLATVRLSFAGGNLVIRDLPAEDAREHARHWGRRSAETGDWLLDGI